MTHKHCDLLSYLESSDNKDYKDLYELIEDQCWRSIFTTKRDYTFLMPGKKTIDKLAAEAKNDEDKAYEKLRSLFINSKHKDLSKATELVNFNNKKIKGEYNKIFKNLKDISIDSLKHITIFNYGDEQIPEQEDKRVKRVAKPKTGSSESDDCGKKEYTQKIMKLGTKQILYKLSSLLEYCEANLSTAEFDSLKNRLDPNWILSWFILVQPGKTESYYISDDVFRAWSNQDKTNEDHGGMPNSNKILEIFETHNTDTDELKGASNSRKSANNMEETKELEDHIKNVYKDNMIHLLEDELRFRFSESSAQDTLDNVNNLMDIDWNHPEKNLVLLCQRMPLVSDIDIGECIKQFIGSSAFKYTLFGDNTIDKLNTAIDNIKNNKNGAGYGTSSRKVINILGNGNRSALKKMGTVDSKHLLKSFVQSLSTSQKKILKELL